MLKSFLIFLIFSALILLVQFPLYATWQIDARDFYEWMCSRHVSQACSHQGRYSYLGNYSTRQECEDARYQSCGGGGDAACMNRSLCVGEYDEDITPPEEADALREEEEFDRHQMEFKEGFERYQSKSDDFRNKVIGERFLNSNPSGLFEPKQSTKANPIIKKNERESIKISIQNAYCSALSAIDAARSESYKNDFSGLVTGMEEAREAGGMGFDKPPSNCPDLDIPVPSLRTSPEFEKIRVTYEKLEKINKELTTIIPKIRDVIQGQKQIESRVRENERKINEIKRAKNETKKTESIKSEDELDDLLKEAEGLKTEANRQKEISDQLAKQVDGYELELKAISSGILKGM